MIAVGKKQAFSSEGTEKRKALQLAHTLQDAPQSRFGARGATILARAGIPRAASRSLGKKLGAHSGAHHGKK